MANMKSGQWAFEGKWDGYRLLVDADHGTVRLRSRRGRDVTSEYPQLRSMAARSRRAPPGARRGGRRARHVRGAKIFTRCRTACALPESSTGPSTCSTWTARSLLRAKYRDRRQLLETLASGANLIVPDLLLGDGPEALEYSRKRDWEGVVAKKRDSTYQPGRRSASWVKEKHWHTQEVVIGGWRAGEGGRTSGIGSLLMGIPAADGLHFAGRVGTGFTERELADLKKTLAPLHTNESPFDAPLPSRDAKGVTFVEPTLVGEVRYSEWTSDDRLRQPSWRGLRPDKKPSEVVRE